MQKVIFICLGLDMDLNISFISEELDYNHT